MVTPLFNVHQLQNKHLPFLLWNPTCSKLINQLWRISYTIVYHCTLLLGGLKSSTFISWVWLSTFVLFQDILVTPEIAQRNKRIKALLYPIYHTRCITTRIWICRLLFITLFIVNWAICRASSAETEKNMCASHKDLGDFMRTMYVDFVLFGHAKTLWKT